jgi:hypothetical protein
VRGPRWGFHALCLAVAVVWLWESSYPGYTISWYLVSLAVLALGAAWIAWVAFFVARERRFSPWLVVAPVGAALLVGMFVASLPLKTRWAMSEPDFTASLASPPSDSQVDSDGVLIEPLRLGSYWIVSVSADKDGTWFEEQVGNLCGSAGFANLPRGLSPDLGNGTGVVSLGNSWYAYDIPC